ncbi:P-loop NTPase, partial [Rhizobium johnstonii]|uniref:P-loop NTPase n=1 Tax=Rhizobium johnstonii TaxID=3019933 RepID=UPI003F97720D
LLANGLRVGILDSDIYGPSMPRLLKISGRPTQIDGRIINPMENYGLKVNWASPVPGGMSTTRTSSSPKATSRSICNSADWTIGPRQIIAVSS